MRMLNENVSITSGAKGIEMHGSPVGGAEHSDPTEVKTPS